MQKFNYWLSWHGRWIDWLIGLFVGVLFYWCAPNELNLIYLLSKTVLFMPLYLVVGFTVGIALIFNVLTPAKPHPRMLLFLIELGCLALFYGLTGRVEYNPFYAHLSNTIFVFIGAVTLQEFLRYFIGRSIIDFSKMKPIH